MSVKGATKKLSTKESPSDCQKQGLAEALFAMDEDVTHSSPEKPSKSKRSPVKLVPMSQERSDAQDRAFSAIMYARHLTESNSTNLKPDRRSVKKILPKKLFR
ncbi:MAG: hypothetical protein AB7I18_13135 [Candidatus Berkiella sp.]